MALHGDVTQALIALTMKKLQHEVTLDLCPKLLPFFFQTQHQHMVERIRKESDICNIIT